MTESGEAAQTPLAYRVVRGGIWVALSSYSNLIIGFLANILLTRALAPEAFGIFSYGLFFFSLFNIRNRIPIGYGFIQHKDTNGELIGTHLLLNLFGALITLVLAGLAVPVLHFMGKPWEVAWVILSLASVGLADSISGTASALLDKDLQYGRTSIISSVAFPLSYLPGLWLAFHHGGYWALLAQNASYALMFMAGVIWLSRRRVPHLWRLHWRFDRQVARFLLGFGVTVGIGSLSAMLVGQFDNFLVGTFVGIETLGFYDRAYGMAQWPTLLVTGVITRIAIYTYARLQDDPVRLKKTVTMTFWMITTLGLPLAISLFAAAPDVISLLYTDRWLPSVIFLRFLVVFAVVQPLMGDAGELFIAVGRPKYSVTIALVEAVILIGAGTPLTLRFGALGTCVAVGLAFLAGLVLTYYYLRNVVDISIWETWGVPGFTAILTLVSFFILFRFVDVSNLPLFFRTMVKISYTGLTFFALLFAFRPRTTLERVQYVWRLARGK